MNCTWLGRKSFCGVPLCCGIHGSGKMRFWASLAIKFSKQACRCFALSVIFFLWQFSDIFCHLKPENILNVSTKLFLMPPDSTWLVYLYKHSYIYILLTLNYCIKTYQILHAYYRITESQNVRGWKGPLWVIYSNPPAEAGSNIDTLCIRYTYKGVLLNSYKKGWW